jgi:hypothetical protein
MLARFMAAIHFGISPNNKIHKENIMKYVLSLAFCFAAAHAMADEQSPEVFSLSAATFITKCTTQFCEQGTEIGPEVDIALDACTGVPYGYYSCSGTWSDTEELDGFSFTSNITVIKTVMTPMGSEKVNAQVSYQIVASTGPTLSSQQPTSVTINLGQLGQVTDAVTITGETLNVNSGAAVYTPNLTIAPVTTGPIPGPFPQPGPASGGAALPVH